MKGYRVDKAEFLYNLTKGKGYSVTDSNQAVYSSNHMLVAFGNGDLTVREKHGVSYYPVSYEGNNHYELTNKEEKFIIQEMEVFNLGIVRDY